MDKEHNYTATHNSLIEQLLIRYFKKSDPPPPLEGTHIPAVVGVPQFENHCFKRRKQSGG